MTDPRKPRKHPNPHLRFRGHLMRVTARLDRYQLMLGLLVCAVGGLIGLVAALSVNGIPLQDRFEFSVIVPGDTPPLKSGDQIRVAGKVAGIVTDVEPQREFARVEAELDPDFAPIGENASVHVGVLIGTSLAFLVLDPGDAEHPLEEGTTIPASAVSLSSSLPQALEAFDFETREALAHNFEVFGEGSLGRGRQTNEALEDFRAIGEVGVPLLDALTPRRGTLRSALHGAAGFTAGLRGPRPDDVGATTMAVSEVLGTLADHAETSGELLERLADVEREMLLTLPIANRALSKTALLFEELLPGADAIADQLPDFIGLFQQGPILSAGTSRFGHAARPTLHALTGTVPLLEYPAAALPVATGPILDLTASVDEYRSELDLLAAGLYDAVNGDFFGVPAIRVSGSLGCHDNRNPYPDPGAVFEDRAPC